MGMINIDLEKVYFEGSALNRYKTMVLVVTGMLTKAKSAPLLLTRSLK